MSVSLRKSKAWLTMVIASLTLDGVPSRTLITSGLRIVIEI
jgi:hypothetical protein